MIRDWDVKRNLSRAGLPHVVLSCAVTDLARRTGYLQNPRRPEQKGGFRRTLIAPDKQHTLARHRRRKPERTMGLGIVLRKLGRSSCTGPKESNERRQGGLGSVSWLRSRIACRPRSCWSGTGAVGHFAGQKLVPVLGEGPRMPAPCSMKGNVKNKLRPWPAASFFFLAFSPSGLQKTAFSPHARLWSVDSCSVRTQEPTCGTYTIDLASSVDPLGLRRFVFRPETCSVGSQFANHGCIGDFSPTAISGRARGHMVSLDPRLL